MIIYPKSLVFVIFPLLCFVFVRYNKTAMHHNFHERGLSLKGDNSLEGKLFLVETPHGCHIFIMERSVYLAVG